MNFSFIIISRVFILYGYIGNQKIFVSVPIVPIQAVQGDQVFLPCDLTKPDPNDQVVLVLWYREDMGTPIYR